MFAVSVTKNWRHGVKLVSPTFEIFHRVSDSTHFCDVNIVNCRTISCTQPRWSIPRKPSWDEKLELPNVSFLTKMYKKVFKDRIPKEFLRVAGELLVVKCTQADTYEEFVKVFDLPDTLHTWFLITELHIWMINVRIMAGNSENSHIVKKSMIKTLWADCSARISKIGGISSKKKQEFLNEIHEEFLAALLIYDLGIGSDDKELGNAMWRRFFCAENPPDFSKIEILVQYVRENTANLEKVSLNDIILHQKIDWKPLRRPIL